MSFEIWFENEEWQVLGRYKNELKSFKTLDEALAYIKEREEEWM